MQSVQTRDLRKLYGNVFIKSHKETWHRTACSEEQAGGRDWTEDSGHSGPSLRCLFTYIQEAIPARTGQRSLLSTSSAASRVPGTVRPHSTNKNRSAGQFWVWALLFIKSGLGPEIIPDICGPPLVEPGATDLFFIQQNLWIRSPWVLGFCKWRGIYVVAVVPSGTTDSSPFTLAPWACPGESSHFH